MKNNFQKVVLLLILIALIVIIVVLLNCLCTKKYPESARYPHIPIDSTQLVVWRNPDSSKESFKKWVDAFKANYGEVSETYYCKDCDSDLLLLQGKGPQNFIQGSTVGGGSNPTCTTCKPSGEDGPVFFSYNFSVDIDDPFYEESPLPGYLENSSKKDSAYYYLSNPENFRIPETVNFDSYIHSSQTVVVAVIDTGLDTTGISQFVYNDNDAANAVKESCLGSDAKKGWNFVDSNAKYQDDYKHKHGTDVAKLIITQAIEYQQNPVKILPIKVFDKNGHCDLFHILCALAYAKDRGASIVNASFGYYSPKVKPDVSNPDVSAILFEAYIKHYLTDSGILMLCAAGNKNDDVEKLVYSSTHPADMRNLDSVSFYPASFAGNKSMPNIIAVTTIDANGMVSENQNLSPNIVDIGFVADLSPQWFVKPDAHPKTITGSSFATPLATGKIAANYYLISAIIQTQPTPRYAKDDIWVKLGGGLLQKEAAVSQIKDQHSMTRQKRSR